MMYGHVGRGKAFRAFDQEEVSEIKVPMDVQAWARRGDGKGTSG